MEKKFGILRIVSTIFKVLAWIILVIGILGACGSIALGAMPGLLGAGSTGGRDALGLGVGGMVGGIIVGLIAIFASVLEFLLMYAFGDLISLLISLEENTRLTAEHLVARPVAPPPALSTSKGVTTL